MVCVGSGTCVDICCIGAFIMLPITTTNIHSIRFNFHINPDFLIVYRNSNCVLQIPGMPAAYIIPTERYTIASFMTKFDALFVKGCIIAALISAIPFAICSIRSGASGQAANYVLLYSQTPHSSPLPRMLSSSVLARTTRCVLCRPAQHLQ